MILLSQDQALSLLKHTYHSLDWDKEYPRRVASCVVSFESAVCLGALSLEEFLCEQVAAERVSQEKDGISFLLEGNRLLLKGDGQCYLTSLGKS